MIRRVVCPSCHVPVDSVHATGPRGSTSATAGPRIVYPCQCWLTAGRADRVVRELSGLR